jgi:putative transposase
VIVEEGYRVVTVCRALQYPKSSYYATQERLKNPKQGSSNEAVQLDEQIRKLIKDHPEFGYRRVWAHLRFRMNIEVGRNKVHRIIKKNGWQATSLKRPGKKQKQTPLARKRLTVVDPEEKIVVDSCNLRWATDLTKVYVAKVGWMNLIPVIDCGSAKILSYVFSDRGRALESVTALEDAIISRFGSFETIPEDLCIRTDSGSIFLADAYQKCLKITGINQEFTPYRCPSANGVIERWMKTFKEECAWCHVFETIEEAEAKIGKWIKYYNEQRMHSRLGYQSPNEYEETLQKIAAVSDLSWHERGKDINEKSLMATNTIRL